MDSLDFFLISCVTTLRLIQGLQLISEALNDLAFITRKWYQKNQKEN